MQDPIPSYTLISGPTQIRFDLPTTLLAFIQSRGRARVLASHMVLMLQAGNAAQAQLVTDVKSCAASLTTA